MKLNHNRGAIPLYLQIHTILKEKIEDGTYEYGNLIPSEIELEKVYKVSRITIRQAIAELEKDGYVRRARGKGTTVTYVKRIDESLCQIRSFSKEMVERGLTPGTSYIDINKCEASEEVAHALEVDVDSEVYHLYRVRTADGEPIVIFETYLSGDYEFPLEKEKYMAAMYDVFEEMGIKVPVKVKENFQAILADQRIAKQLGVREGHPVFKRTRIAYNIDNKAIEYTLSYYRGDRYSYSVQLGN